MKLSRKTSAGLAIAGVALVALIGLGIWRSSGEPLPNRDPTGERFPAVVGQTLEKKAAVLPEAFAGSPAALLIGYSQRAQFDIDRWLMGMLQAEVDAQLVELPTIPGLVASIASDWIDDGMRSGIPREDWGVVITLYGDAARPVAELTGTEGGQLTRVVVLDADGTVVWFDDEGYSARKAMAVASLVEELRGRNLDEP